MIWQPLDFTLHAGEVTLRPLRSEDAAELAAASGESRAHYLFSPVPDGFDATAGYVGRALEQKSAGERFPFVVVWRGRVVGTTSYSELQPWRWPANSEQQRFNAPDAVEIGYTWLAESAQRTGCNTQAKLLLLEYAFETWRVHSVFLRTDARNQRSRSAIERLGCTFDGIRRAHMPGADGTVRSSAFYSLLAAEWPAVRDQLRVKLLAT